MSGFATLLYVLYSSSLNYSGYASGGTIGRVLFIGIVGVELFLVTFIAPTFTAGAISGERERQTYGSRHAQQPNKSMPVQTHVTAPAPSWR